MWLDGYTCTLRSAEIAQSVEMTVGDRELGASFTDLEGHGSVDFRDLLLSPTIPVASPCPIRQTQAADPREEVSGSCVINGGSTDPRSNSGSIAIALSTSQVAIVRWWLSANNPQNTWEISVMTAVLSRCQRPVSRHLFSGNSAHLATADLRYINVHEKLMNDSTHYLTCVQLPFTFLVL